MKESMRVELIENKGPNNMGYELKRSFESASAVDIAVAFITSKGLDLILNDIKKVLDHESSSIRILTRISKDAFNEPSALRSLLDLCKDYEGSAEARITRLSSDFHEKCMHAERLKFIKSDLNLETLQNLYAKLGEMKCAFGGNEERNKDACFG